MPRVILQPSANKVAQQHYFDTIVNPVSLDFCEGLADQDVLAALWDIYPAGAAPLWGVTPGSNDLNIRKWDRIDRGDAVLFAARGTIFSAATVALKFRSQELASALWGWDDRGQTWEFMYALDEMRDMSVPYLDFNRAVGYQDENVIQGFTVLDEERSALAFDFLDLWSDRYEPAVSEQSFWEAVQGLSGPLEAQVTTWARTEQSRARALLLGTALEGACRLCGRLLPKEFLVAAHKKRRADCSDDEKRDIRNVVMLCCLLGCDAIYERGLVTVGPNGEVLRSSRIAWGSPLSDYLQEHVPVQIYVADEELEYFEWHRLNTFIP